MPKRITPLTDTLIRKAKPKEKQHTLFDGEGLYLLVIHDGGKLWCSSIVSKVRKN